MNRAFWAAMVCALVDIIARDHAGTNQMLFAAIICMALDHAATKIAKRNPQP